MPMHSSHTSNIIAGQTSQLSMQSQYAQAVSQMGGFTHAGGTPIQDPRAQMASAAGGLGGVAASAPFAAVGAASTAAMFGAAPKMLDGWGMSASAARAGYAGGGIAGGLGVGGMMAGAYMGIGAGLGWMENQMMTGAQTRGALNSQISGMMPNASMQKIGQMSGAVENISRMGVGSIAELTGLLEQGSAAGNIDTSSISKFQQSFTKLVNNVRSVANALNSTMNEAHAAMESVRALGVSSDAIASVTASAGTLGRAGGLSPIQTGGALAAGAGFASQMGSSIDSGAVNAVRNASVFNTALRSSNYSGMTAGSASKYTGAAMRFFGSRQGRMTLGAMMNERGEMDEELASQMASGALSGADIRRMYSANMARSGGRGNLMANQSAIAGSFISKYGGAAIGGPLDAMTSGSSRQQYMRQALTGLTGNDLGTMGQFNQDSSGLRQRVSAAARAGLNAGMGNRSISDHLKQSFDQLTGPLRDRLRSYGAEITQGINEAMEGVRQEITGSGPHVPLDRGATSRLYGMARLGNTSALGQLGSISRGGSAGSTMMNPRLPTSGIRAALPMGLNPQMWGPNASLLNMPVGGLVSASSEATAMWGGAATAGGLATGWGLGRISKAAMSAGRAMFARPGAPSKLIGGALMGGSALAGLLGAGSYVGGAGAGALTVATLGANASDGKDYSGAYVGPQADNINQFAAAGMLKYGEHVTDTGREGAVAPVMGGHNDMSMTASGITRLGELMAGVKSATGTMPNAADREKILSEYHFGGTGATGNNKKDQARFRRIANANGQNLDKEQAATMGIAMGLFGGGAGVYTWNPAGTVKSAYAALKKRITDSSGDKEAHKVINSLLEKTEVSVGSKSFASIMADDEAARAAGAPPEALARSSQVLQAYLRAANSKNKFKLPLAKIAAAAAELSKNGAGFYRAAHHEEAQRYMKAVNHDREIYAQERGLASYSMAASGVGAGLSGSALGGFADKFSDSYNTKIPNDLEQAAKNQVRVSTDYADFLLDNDVSPAAAATMAAAQNNGTLTGSQMSGITQSYSRIKSAMGMSAGKRANALIRATTGQGVRLDAASRAFLGGKTDDLPAALEAQLTANATQMMRRKYGGKVTAAQVADATGVLIAGVRDMANGKAGAAAKRMNSYFSTQGHPTSPKSGMGAINEANSRVAQALGEFAEAVEIATRNMPQGK